MFRLITHTMNCLAVVSDALLMPLIKHVGAALCDALNATIKTNLEAIRILA